nr:HepT-like ribonuclease domain-containing protein [Paenibacillus xylanexedens]
MYYVNREQIARRLQAVPEVAEGLRHAVQAWDGGLVLGMVQERCLHLAIEIVTDVGSYLIDGFIMRDASSYDDIIQINYEEKVFDESTYEVLRELVLLRKPLVQDYFSWQREVLHPLSAVLPEILEQFSDQVSVYVEKELGPFQGNEGQGPE